MKGFRGISMMIRAAACIDENEPLSKALRLLEKEDIVVVTHDGKYAGELAALPLSSFSGDAKATKVGHVARKGAVIEGTPSDEQVAQFFAEGRVEDAVVVDKHENVVGVVDKRAVLEKMAAWGLTGAVRERMRPAYSLEAAEPAAKALHLMTRNATAQVIVIEGHRAVGKLTAKDAAMKLTPYHHLPYRTRKPSEKMDVEQESLHEVMRELQDADFVDAGSSLKEAARKMMARAPLEPLVVLEDNKLKGTLSFADIVAGHATRLAPSAVHLVGMTEEVKFSQASIEAEAEKLLKRVGNNASVQLRFKSARKSKAKTEYEIKGTLYADDKEYHAGLPPTRAHKESWDLHLSVKEVLQALLNEYRHKNKKG